MRHDGPDFDLRSDIEALVADGRLDEASVAYEIARQVMDGGYESLSSPQRTIWDARVWPAISTHREHVRWRRTRGSARHGASTDGVTAAEKSGTPDTR